MPKIEVDLTTDDCQTLVEAVDSWESSDSLSGMASSLLMMGLGGVDKEERKTLVEQTMNEAKAKTELKKEKAILIKAKLIGLRNKIEAASLAEELRDAGVDSKTVKGVL